MTDLVPVQAVEPANPPLSLVDALRYAIAQADTQRKALVDSGDVDSLAVGLRDLRRITADLRILTTATEDDLARLMPAKILTVEGVGTFERRKGTDRKKWQSEDLLAHVIRRAAVDETTGEVFPADVTLARLLEVLPSVVPFTGSLGWRVTALRALGIDPDQWCETAPGRTAVQLHETDKES